jgi:hypothetical protein
MGSSKFTNQEVLKLYLAMWIITEWQGYCEGSNVVDGTNDCGMTAKRMGMLAVRVRNMKKALTVNMETVTLTGKCR